MCRIEWRPLSAHNNKGLGPLAYQHLLQSGSHHHSFEINWAHCASQVRRGTLPLSVPIKDEPEDFGKLLALVGSEFKISNMDLVPVPPWQFEML